MDRQHAAHEQEHENELEVLEHEPPGAVERRLAESGGVADSHVVS